MPADTKRDKTEAVLIVALTRVADGPWTLARPGKVHALMPLGTWQTSSLSLSPWWVCGAVLRPFARSTLYMTSPTPSGQSSVRSCSLAVLLGGLFVMGGHFDWWRLGVEIH
jgi:hypothetical protein